MRDMIDMAREVKATAYTNRHYPDRTTYTFGPEQLKAFEALVRADQDEKYKWDVHSCGPTCERYACVAMREAVLAEREACAKVCEDHAPTTTPTWVSYAAAIRARGNT